MSKQRRLEAERAVAAFARENGWHDLTADLPVEVAAAASMPQRRIAWETEYDGHRLWVVWRRRKGSGGCLPLVGVLLAGWFSLVADSDNTLYFLDLGVGEGFPDISVERRTPAGSIAAAIGQATVSDEFRNKFDVQTDVSDAELRLLTPVLRQAMVRGEIPPWRITDGLLVMEFFTAPQKENLAPTVECMVRLSSLLGRD